MPTKHRIKKKFLNDLAQRQSETSGNSALEKCLYVAPSSSITTAAAASIAPATEGTKSNESVLYKCANRLHAQNVLLEQQSGLHTSVALTAATSTTAGKNSVCSMKDEKNENGMDVVSIQPHPAQRRKRSYCAVEERKSDDIIWIQIGKNLHPAYELANCHSSIHTSDEIWVEWLSNGKKECVSKHQVVSDGLPARKRQRPNYFVTECADDLTSKTSTLTQAPTIAAGKKMKNDTTAASPLPLRYDTRPVPRLIAKKDSAS